MDRPGLDDRAFVGIMRGIWAGIALWLVFGLLVMWALGCSSGGGGKSDRWRSGVFHLPDGSPVNWRWDTQPCAFDPSLEAEYVAQWRRTTACLDRQGELIPGAPITLTVDYLGQESPITGWTRPPGASSMNLGCLWQDPETGEVVTWRHQLHVAISDVLVKIVTNGHNYQRHPCWKAVR